MVTKLLPNARLFTLRLQITANQDQKLKMKRTVNLIALLCLVVLTTTTAAFATTNKNNNKKGTEKNDKDVKARVVVLPGKMHGTYKLTYVGNGAQLVNVNIVDEAGNLVYSDRIRSTEGFQKPYNLSNLGAGNYTFEVIDAGGKTTRAITYKQPSIAAFAFAGTNRCRLIVADDMGQPLYINVYDAKGTLLHKDKVTTGKGFTKIYEIDRAAQTSAQNGTQNGTKGFTFQVSTQGQVLRSIKL